MIKVRKDASSSFLKKFFIEVRWLKAHVLEQRRFCSVIPAKGRLAEGSLEESIGHP